MTENTTKGLNEIACKGCGHMFWRVGWKFKECVDCRLNKIKPYPHKPRQPRKVRPKRTIRPRTRFEVLMRYKFACQYCGRKAPDVELVVDHIYPFSKGGTDEASNLTCACFECNAGKGALIITA